MEEPGGAVAPGPGSKRISRIGAVVRFVIGVGLGLVVSCFLVAFEAQFIDRFDRPAMYGTLVVLDLVGLVLMVRWAIRSRSSFIRGIVTGAALAILLAATCWGLVAFGH